MSIMTEDPEEAIISKNHEEKCAKQSLTVSHDTQITQAAQATQVSNYKRLNIDESAFIWDSLDNTNIKISFNAVMWKSLYVSRILDLDVAKFYESVRIAFICEYPDEYNNILRKIDTTINNLYKENYEYIRWCKLHLLWVVCTKIFLTIKSYIYICFGQYDDLFEDFTTYYNYEDTNKLRVNNCTNLHHDIEFYLLSKEKIAREYDTTYTIWINVKFELVVVSVSMSILSNLILKVGDKLKRERNTLLNNIGDFLNRKELETLKETISDLTTQRNMFVGGESHESIRFKTAAQANIRTQRAESEYYKETKKDITAKHRHKYYDIVIERIVQLNKNRDVALAHYKDITINKNLSQKYDISDRSLFLDKNVIAVFDSYDSCLELYSIDDMGHFGVVKQVCSYDNITFDDLKKIQYEDVFVEHYVGLGSKMFKYVESDDVNSLLTLEQLISNATNNINNAYFQLINGYDDKDCIAINEHINTKKCNWELLTSGKITNKNGLRKLSYFEAIAGLSTWFEPSNKSFYWVNFGTFYVSDIYKANLMVKKKRMFTNDIEQILENIVPNYANILSKNIDTIVPQKNRHNNDISIEKSVIKKAIESSRPIAILSSKHIEIRNKCLLI